jgi:hypothetical protein
MVKYILVCGGVISYVQLFIVQDFKLKFTSGIGKGVIGEYHRGLLGAVADLVKLRALVSS